jgi:hypothetical protein
MALLAMSYAARLSAAMGGFTSSWTETWERLAAAVVGFLAVRTLMVPRSRPEGSPSSELEYRHWKS